MVLLSGRVEPVIKGTPKTVTRSTHALIARIVLPAVLCASAAVPAVADDTDGLSPARLRHVSAMAERYVDEGRLPGVVTAVQRRGQTPRIEAIGAVSNDSIFRIYSMTKPVTTVAVLMLAEEGRLMLTDPVARTLPVFADMSVLQPDGSTGPASHTITLHHLLTHTAGLSYADDAPGAPAIYAASDHWAAGSLTAFCERVAQLPLAFEPGERWHYSVANDVLGCVVEAVSGQRFEDFLQHRIFEPLDMEDTSFAVPDEKLHRFLSLYSRDGEGMRQVESPTDSPYRAPGPWPSGGGGLVSTASDYLRFAQMLLNGGEGNGKRLLGRRSVELMMTNHLGPQGEMPLLNEAWVARTENRSGRLDLGLGYGYGGYVVLDVARNGVPGSVGTYAWGGGASTYFFIDPQEQLIGLFLTQLTPSDSYPLRAQFRALVYSAIAD